MKKHFLLVTILAMALSGCSNGSLQEWRASGGLLGQAGFKNSTQKLSDVWAGHPSKEILNAWGQPYRTFSRDGYSVLHYRNIEIQTTQYGSPQYGYSEERNASSCDTLVYTKNSAVSHIRRDGSGC